MDEPRLAPRASVEVSEATIDVGRLAEAVADPTCGGIAIFLGTVRDHSEGKEGVTHLEYEAYAGVVERKIAELAEEAAQRWELGKVAVAHRVGVLDVGEVSVGVAVSAEHRDQALEAARFLIDELKARAPIWKKEHWPGGAEWVREGTEEPPAGGP